MSSEEEEEKEYSRVLIRLGDFEVELEGTQNNVKALMGDRLYNFISGLQEVLGEIPIEIKEPKKEAAKRAPPTEYPPPVGKPKSIGDALTKLMIDAGWGNEPRTFGEIKNALEVSGIYYSKGALAGQLNYLTKKGTLRRLGARGNFRYVAT